jgi:nitroimidazol reductase NimA-like FMN-containing flavoprotein (pyridoxamine 5'-phosphate oxidase superfamily)
MGTGRIGMVTSAEERAKGIEVLMRHYYPGEYSVSEMCMGKTAVIKLEIEHISCKVNKR